MIFFDCMCECVCVCAGVDVLCVWDFFFINSLLSRALLAGDPVVSFVAELPLVWLFFSSTGLCANLFCDLLFATVPGESSEKRFLLSL